jgi:hypothetical protein
MCTTVTGVIKVLSILPLEAEYMPLICMCSLHICVVIALLFVHCCVYVQVVPRLRKFNGDMRLLNEVSQSDCSCCCYAGLAAAAATVILQYVNHLNFSVNSFVFAACLHSTALYL